MTGAIKDVNGNTIFDTTGLVAVMKRIATNQPSSYTATPPNNSAIIVPTTNTNYTLTRTQTVMVMGFAACQYSNTSDAFNLSLGLEASNPNQWVGGTQTPSPSSVVQADTAGNPPFIAITLWAVATLGSGGYQAAWILNSGTNVGTAQVRNMQIDVFLIGG